MEESFLGSNATHIAFFAMIDGFWVFPVVFKQITSWTEVLSKFDTAKEAKLGGFLDRVAQQAFYFADRLSVHGFHLAPGFNFGSFVFFIVAKSTRII